MLTGEKVLVDNDNSVKYCSKCLSLKIKYEDIQDIEYCGDCGCTDIIEAPFEDWEEKYESRYGHKFVEKSNDPRKSYIFQMSIGELKQKMYESKDNWREVIRIIHPKFPRGFSKIDTILLFFDYLIRENRLDEFKILLTKIKL